MRRLLLAALPLLSGCASLQNLDVSGLTGGRMQSLNLTNVAKAANAIRKSAEDISESEEYYIGRAVAAQILGRYRPLDDRRANVYVQAVLQSVALASDRPSVYKGWHAQVLDSEEVNAFAAPGGFVFVTKGLLGRVRSEDELAAVLAHEVAHVSRKHGLKAIQSARLAEAFSLLGQEATRNSGESLGRLTGAFEGAVGDIVNKLVVNGYSRDKEFEADRFGQLYARDANYDPEGLRGFLGRLEVGGSGGLFKTHPAPAKRVAELRRSAPAPGYAPSPARERRFAAVLAAR